jgi:two-component system phosphate regulon sensor histidine kinase PhoR
MHQQLAERFDDLRREKAESAALVETMVEGVIAADARGRITSANGAARRLLGYSDAQPLPAITELFRGRDARATVTAALSGVEDQSTTFELDGRILLMTARGLPQGGAVLVLHDLSDARRIEAVRRDFVANVSHELRTPLTSISGYAETLLTDRPDEPTARKFLETILANGRRMQRLIDDLLDLSRIESGHWQPAPVDVVVAAAAREAWACLDDRPGARGVRFETHTGDMTVHADPDALRQILTNLFDNALRHTPGGGAITVRAEPDSGGTRVSVTDTGSGIAREHLPRIFERFYRADAARSREQGGTGLGLAIVKHFVEGHGGSVGAESALGRGTTVNCWFPGAPGHSS